MRSFVSIILAFFIVAASGLRSYCQSDSLESVLNQKYDEKVFTIRNFYVDNDLYFSSDGTAKLNDHVGSWTVASIAIKKIKISTRYVQLAGKRVAEIYDPTQRKFVPLLTKQDFRIFIDHDTSQPDEKLLEALEHIFLGPQDKLGDLVPDYWKPLDEGRVQLIPQNHGPVCFRIRGEVDRSVDGKIVIPCQEDAKDKNGPPDEDSNIDISTLPYVVKGIKPPKPTFTPDPEYDPVARAAVISGQTILHVIVAIDGTTTGIMICRPLGFGLDDKAVSAVRKWRFEPATLNGVPVPARITVQTEFHFSN